MKKRGYATGHFGKWHIGPVSQDGTYGIDSIISDDEQAERGKKRNTYGQRGRDAHIYDDAIRFIEQHKDGPFYVNVWGHISHFKVDPPELLVTRWSGLEVDENDFLPQMIAKFNDAMQRYLAEVEPLDDAVGRLLKRLDELGLRENTIVVFNSDQGAGMGEITKGGLQLNMMGCNGSYVTPRATTTANSNCTKSSLIPPSRRTSPRRVRTS